MGIFYPLSTLVILPNLRPCNSASFLLPTIPIFHPLSGLPASKVPRRRPRTASDEYLRSSTSLLAPSSTQQHPSVLAKLRAELLDSIRVNTSTDDAPVEHSFKETIVPNGSERLVMRALKRPPKDARVCTHWGN